MLPITKSAFDKGKSVSFYIERGIGDELVIWANALDCKPAIIGWIQQGGLCLCTMDRSCLELMGVPIDVEKGHIKLVMKG
jgi:hypothetical protein